jgi:NADPH:quinone reductase-like Zn-dependent oxidoreductase
MKAWLLDSFTGLGSLRIADVADPIPAAGQVLLAIEYAGLNPADRYLAQGEYPARPPLPHILGRDGIGRVAGGGEKRLILRGPVGVSAPGTFAGLTAAPLDCLVEIPAGWTDEEAIKVFELSQNLTERWLTADYASKRQILDIVFSNFRLDGVSLCYEMRKPFAFLAKGPFVPSNRGDRI